MIKNLHIGTSGWSYNWKGIFYPENLKSSEYLNYYSKIFNATEVNSSFYHYTMQKTIDKWIDLTPKDFKFCVKLNREITHYKKLKDINENLNLFMSRFLFMKEKLGLVLIQLPASFKFDYPLIKDFYDLINLNYPNNKFAFEVRNTTWFTDESFNLMKKYNITFVISDSGNKFPYSETITSDTIYIRLHGNEKLYSSSYTDNELIKYSELIINILNNNKDVWVFFNNTMTGEAIKNALRLEEIISLNI